LSLTLALPSWGARDCCCSRRHAEDRSLHDSAPLPPCCAARMLKAAEQRRSTSSALPVCGCDRELAPAGVVTAARSPITAVHEAQRMVAFRIERATVEGCGETLPQRMRAAAPALTEPDLTQLCRSLT
jgi:hypothetical protein